MTSDEIQFAALGTALLLGSLAALWRVASLRGDLFDRWNRRVELVEAGLSERALFQLIDIQRQIAELLLPPPGEAFNPITAIEDPGQLEESSKQVLRVLRARRGLSIWLRQLLLVGPLMLVALVMTVIGIVLFFGDLAGLFASSWSRQLGFFVGTIGVVGASVGFMAYVYLQQKLSAA